MLTLALSLLVTQTPQHRLFMQPNLPRANLAFFEAFPASGAGTTTACSTTAPTGARGEVLTATRASSGTCTAGVAGGLRTTAIADGDLSVLSSNVARVEYSSDGVLSLLIESARTNSLLRFIEYCDAAWANVGTPALTGASVTGTACATTTPQTSPLLGTFATAAVSIDDNDVGAYEGRSQAVTVSAGAAYFMSCYVKAGTRAEARITLDGTAATITGLSSTTWSIVEVADASSSGVSIAAEVMSGDAVGDTGSVIFGGCQVEAGTYRTSIIPTVGVAVPRSADSAPNFTVPSTAVGSFAVSLDTSSQFRTSNQNRIGFVSNNGTNFWELYVNSACPSCSVVFGQTIGGSTKTISSSNNILASSTNHIAAWVSPSASINVIVNGTVTSSAVGVLGALTGVTRVYLGDYSVPAYEVDGLIGRVCLDPDPSRCL